jgi:hypothetical protein
VALLPARRARVSTLHRPAAAAAEVVGVEVEVDVAMVDGYGGCPVQCEPVDGLICSTVCSQTASGILWCG